MMERVSRTFATVSIVPSPRVAIPRPDNDGLDIEILTEAEFMLLLGKESRTRVRQGESLDAIANRHRLSPVQILAAMEFAASSNAVVLRRLIDDADR